MIGVSDEMKGQRPAGYVVLTSDQAAPAVGGEDESALLDELRLIVRKTVGPVADFKDVVIVEALPKTRSGKILRKTMRQMADGDEVTVPSTIEDAAALESLRARIGASVRHGSVGAES